MATVEKPRPSSVKALARTIPALSHPAPPSPPLILRNPDVIILPSVPTHEPEDDLPLTHDLGLSFASSSRLEPDRAEDGEEEEEEEVLEELRDESDDVQDRTWIRSDLGASLAAVQSTAIVALESLVQTFTPSSERGEVEVQRILLDLQDCVRQLSSRLCGSQPGSPKPYSAQLEASQRSLPGSAHKWGEGLNDELFVRLDSLLGQLTQSQDPVVASRDDLQLANALGALAASCEGLRDNSLDLAVALREEPYPFQRPGSSASLLSNNRRSSLNTARSTPSEELRDPFAEIQEPDVFATLSRMMTSLSSRAVPNTPPPPSPHSPPLEATAAFNPTLSSLAHQGNLSKRSSLTEETQPFSGEANHAEERLLPTGNMTAWAQVAELLSITKELVASRRAAVTPARPYNDAPLSPRARSRRGSSIGHGQEHFETVHEAAQKRHSVGSNRSAPMIAAASSTFIDAKSLRRQKSGSSLGAISLPPRYSDDEFRNSPTAAHLAGFAVHNSWQTRKRQSSSLPEYSDENGRGLDFCSQAEKKDSPRDEVASSGSASASSSSVYAARSPQDLFLVQASIERLYTAVPQLDDQRAALSPSKLRDVNLQELMDRINRSGRMEDQRAAPPTLRNKVAASPTSARPSASRSSSPVLRTFSASSVTKRFSVSNLAATFRRVSQPEVEGKGKARELEKEDHPDPRSLGPLIDSMHKAQDLSMADQRVELKPRRKKQHKVLALAGHDVSSGKGAARDDEELLGILSANSRSRMTNQDFVRKPVSSARTIGNNYYGLPGHLSEEPLTTRRRAGSAPFVSSAMSIDTSGSFDPEVPFSSLIERQDVAYRQGDFGRPWESVSGQTASGLSPNSSEARSAAGKQSSRMPDASVVSQVADVLSTQPSRRLSCIAEHQPHLNYVSVTVTLHGASVSEVKAAEPFFRVLPPNRADTQASPTTGWSSPVDGGGFHGSDRTGGILALSHPTLPGSVHFKLPAPVLLSQQPRFTFTQDHYSVKLTCPAQNLRSTFTNSSAESAEFPLSANQLQAEQPSRILCSSCGSEVVDSSSTKRFRALPSQHWEELVDAWMCHGDQELNVSVARGREGMEEGKVIPVGDAWVGDYHLVFPGANANERKVIWDATEICKPDDTARLCCSKCRAVLGSVIPNVGSLSMVASTNPTAPVISSLERCSVKLHKYAILPLLGASGPWERPGPRSLLPMILSSHLLDISRAHAVHHFILEEEETGNARLVLWLFTPRITLSLYSQDSSPPSSTSSAHDIQRSEGGLVPASKVLYQLVESSSSHGSEQQERGDSATARRKPLGNIHMEPISYPSFQCDLIQALLDASNLAYPASRRKFMDWNLGWLERVAR